MEFPWWYIFYNVIIWITCFVISYKRSYNTGFQINNNESPSDKSTIIGLYLLFSLGSLFTFYGGDVDRYRFFVEVGVFDYGNKEHDPVEPFYVLLSELANHNFLIWKMMVYLPALLLTYISTIRLDCKNYQALLCFVIFNLISFGSTRAVLAYSVFLLGLSFFKQSRVFFYFIGFCCIYITQYLHSSMIVPILLSPLMFVKLTRKRLAMLAIFFPIAIVILNSTYGLLFQNMDFMGTQYGYKFGTYVDEDSTAGSSYMRSFMSTVQAYYSYFAVGWLMLLAIKAEINNLLPTIISKIVRVSFFLLYSSLVIVCSSLPNSLPIFSRYFTMVPFMLFVAWPFILMNPQVIPPSKVKRYINLTSAYLVIRIFVYVYYGSFK